MKFFGSRPAKMKGELKLYVMCRAFCWYRIVCVSLSPRLEEPNSEVKKLINVPTSTTVSLVYLSPPVFLHEYMYSCY